MKRASAPSKDAPPSPLADLPRDEVIMLPPTRVIEAGLARFVELAKLNWPTHGGGEFKLSSFDMQNDWQLRITLGLVYMAMKAAEK